MLCGVTMVDENDSFEEEEEEEEEETLFEDIEIESITFISETTSVRALLLSVEDEELDLSPVWQRGDVWQPSKKKNLIKSLLVGIPLPSLIIFNEKKGMSSVLDGKQRLTAIKQYLSTGKKKFKLPKYKEDKALDGFSLKDCGGKYFDELPLAAQRKINQTKISLTNLQNLDTSQIYVIFELYNTSGTRLNAAEIRNAVYRNDVCHQFIYQLTGDGESHYPGSIPSSFKSKTPPFTKKLRNLVYNMNPKEENRFKALDFVERYIAYSRCPRPPGEKFKALSTTKIIRAFYEFESDREDIESLGSELIDSLNLVEDLFHQVENCGWTFNGKFHALCATTAMVCSSIANELISNKKTTVGKMNTILKGLGKTIEVPKQQTNTIWRYQAMWVLGFINKMNKDCKAHVIKSHKNLIEAMALVKL
jgi:hypothetical protein